MFTTVATSDESKTIEVTVETTSPNLALVDALARLALIARWHGCTIQLRTCTELCELVVFVGLADVLSLESRGQPEEWVELWVEEVVEPGDTSA